MISWFCLASLWPSTPPLPTAPKRLTNPQTSSKNPYPSRKSWLPLQRLSRNRPLRSLPSPNRWRSPKPWRNPRSQSPKPRPTPNRKSSNRPLQSRWNLNPNSNRPRLARGKPSRWRKNPVLTKEPPLEDAAEEPEMAGEEMPAADPGEVAIEEEGPEPARIPTSLTATLREQGPRYQHRVSRRMRRRGGRDNRQPQPAVGEATRPLDQRPPEQRSAPARNNPEPREKTNAPSISDLLKEGQEIIVQIAKEPLGQKGARITSHIALPGRFLVYMPTVDHIGVSRKIPSDDERLRLKRVLQSNRSGIPGGYIVRTAGEGRTEEELRADMMFLYNLWLDMRQKAERKPAPLADPSRPQRGGAHPARPAHLVVQDPSGWITKRFTKACCASCSVFSRRWSAA